MRHKEIYIRHYFPAVDLNTITDEEFAMRSEEASWLHYKMLSAQATTAFPLMGQTPNDTTIK